MSNRIEQLEQEKAIEQVTNIHTIDISKLAKEEREELIELMKINLLDLLTFEQMQKYLHIGRTTMVKYEYKIPYFKEFGKKLYRKTDIDRIFERKLEHQKIKI